MEVFYFAAGAHCPQHALAVPSRPDASLEKKAKAFYTFQQLGAERRVRGGMKRVSFSRWGCLCVLLVLLGCMIAPAGAEDVSVQHPMLDHAFSLLEEGNPFLARYNRLTGGQIEARLPLGVPYLWGGRAESHVFAKEPDYVVQAAWQSSPAYYRAGVKYLYGFDCTGFVAWAWQKAYGSELSPMDRMLAESECHVLDHRNVSIPPLEELHRLLRPGDVLIMEHPGKHIAIYIGTLRMYGYTEADLPALAGHLDDPLVIHSTVNAQISDRFAELIANGLPKYRVAQVTDGGVCVSLVCEEEAVMPDTVFQQNQTTRYAELPDGTWLTALMWEHVTRFCWYRSPEL